MLRPSFYFTWRNFSSVHGRLRKSGRIRPSCMMQKEDSNVNVHATAIQYDYTVSNSTGPSSPSANTSASICAITSANAGASASVNSSPNQMQSFILFGFDLSNFGPRFQFGASVCGFFIFTLVYAYLQELLLVHIAARQYAVFLCACQLLGYSFWSFLLMSLHKSIHCRRGPCRSRYTLLKHTEEDDDSNNVNTRNSNSTGSGSPPCHMYLLLSLVRAADIGMTNMAMAYINYPMKTLIKSSRVVFTMFGGIMIRNKKYKRVDYVMVAMMVCGLTIFMNADMNSNVVFHPLGVLLLVMSLTCDATFSNYAEKIMNDHDLQQDEFQFRIYSISFLATLIWAYKCGELGEGIQYFFLRNGTVMEINQQSPIFHHYRINPSWSVGNKLTILILFTLTGLCGGSCAGAITKRFGAFQMSITSTTRKACTLFLSFIAFSSENECTPNHILGIALFVSASFLKSLKNLVKSSKSVEATSTSLSSQPTDTV